MVGCLSKKEYTYYRCNNKDRTKQCINKDINKDTLERYIINELNKRVFSNAAIPLLAEKLNAENKKLISEIDEEKIILSNRYEKVIKSINNIVNTIANGHFHPSLDTKLTELEK